MTSLIELSRPVNPPSKTMIHTQAHRLSWLSILQDHARPQLYQDPSSLPPPPPPTPAPPPFLMINAFKDDHKVWQPPGRKSHPFVQHQTIKTEWSEESSHNTVEMKRGRRAVEKVKMKTRTAFLGITYCSFLLLSALVRPPRWPSG